MGEVYLLLEQTLLIRQQKHNDYYRLHFDEEFYGPLQTDVPSGRLMLRRNLYKPMRGIVCFRKWTTGDSNPEPSGYEPPALTSWANGP